MLRSLGLGLGLETFAKLLRVSVSVSEKIWSRKKVSVLVSDKFGLGKKSRFRFRKIWYRKKSLGIGFGQNFGIVIQSLHVDPIGKRLCHLSLRGQKGPARLLC